MFSGKFKKSIIISILCVFVLLNFSFLMAPKKAQAQFVVSVPTLEGMSFREWIVDELIGLAQGVFFEGIMNAMNYFMQKLAYDAATWLAAGGKGQGTLFEYKNFGDYMSDVGGATLGELIGSLSEGWPIDLCDPSGLPEITLSIQLGIAETEEPRPRCEWNEIRSNWDEFVSTNNTRDALREYGQSLRPGEGGLGSIVKLHEKAREEESEAREAAIRDREEGQGVKGVTQPVSGYVETPSLFVRESTTQKLIDGPAEAQRQQVSDSFSLTDSLLSMGLNVVSIFLNTLTSNLFNNMINGFMDVGDLVSETASIWDLGTTEPSGGRIAAEEIFSDLLTPNILSITDYNPTIELTMCPEERGSMHCTIDPSFGAALTQASGGESVTVKDALDRKYLHANWPLIPRSDTSRNQDPNCRNYGYCYSNLVKLRKLRILPIGWEMAANSPANDIGNPVTLGEVVADFDNPSSPYYHLISPNWFIKYPSHQCSLQVYGPNLLNSQGDMREQVCADMPSCIEEDNDGKCLGEWGYCTREKNIWRMSADSCREEFSSCESLTSRFGKKVSYLKNTIDYNSCNAGNIGCVWYSQSKLGDGSWDSNDRIYLNKNVEQCSENFAGCTDLIRKGRGMSINYIKNPSFEVGGDDDNSPDNWSLIGSGGHSYDITGAESYHQMSAISSGDPTIVPSPDSFLVAGGRFRQEISLPAGNFVISFYAKQVRVGEGASAIADILNVYGGPLDTNDANTTCNLLPDGVGLRGFIPGSSYSRTECKFSLNSPEEVYLELYSSGTGVWFDGVQLEEGLRATIYREEGYPYGAEHVFLKMPPNYLGCTGDIERDNSECFNYARVCREADIGCELYAPVNGEPSISAITTNEDICPAECSGYDMFRQGESNFETENPAVFLIPQNAESCTFDVAGCDEFTNTETEERVYASFLRQCSDDFDLSATYYTWEGSDETGYQFKSWILQSGRPISGTETGNPPAYQSGFADIDSCSEEVFRRRTNPDCREFYDAEGNISYRLYSKTVVVTDECVNLRRTLQDEDIAKQENDCNLTGGIWEGGFCIYQGYLAESLVCGQGQNGCRAYTGSTGRNVRVSFSDDFEAGDTSDWEGDVAISTESLQVGGHSLKMGSGGGSKVVGDLVSADSTYTLSFWAKGTIKDAVVYINNVSSTVDSDEIEVYFSNIDNPNVSLATEWRYYTLGPIYIGEVLAGPENLELVFEMQDTGFGTANSYFDNIILKEVIDNVYLIKNSWTIPRSCDMTNQGAPLPQAMVGCQEYKDIDNNSQYFKSFTKLCPEDAVGCEAFIDTRNTISPFVDRWNEGTGFGLDTVTIEEDRAIYLVNNKQFSCAENSVGCSKVGYPKIERNDTPLSEIGYEDRFIRIDPSRFENTLCQDKELFCEEYRTSNGGLLYFKDPRERLCEYRETEEMNGWFRKGTDDACTSCFSFSRSGYEIQKNADICYDGWAGVCDKKYSGCTTLVDVADISEDYPDGKPYFVIRNEDLDTESCNGEVSRLRGCILFNDLNDPSAKYRADSTYLKSRYEKDGEKVNAVSCPGGGNDCKVCLKSTVSPISSETSNETFKYTDIGCVADSDCPTGYYNSESDLEEYTCVSPSRERDYLLNNTNLIVKATPDRVCGEWLSCRSAVTVWDEVAGRDREVCTSVDLCREFEQTGEQEARCTKFVQGSEYNSILGANAYKNRDVSWSGLEYSGYSIPNQYQISDLEAVNIGGGRRLVHVLGDCSNETIECNFEERTCAVLAEVSGGFVPTGRRGVLRNRLCVTGIDGKNYNNLFVPRARQSFTKRSCRAYPEQTSPFPPTVANWDAYLDENTKGGFSDKKQGFTGAQVCERYIWLDANADNIVDDGELVPQDCECSYKKASYGRGTVVKYTGYNQGNLPEGICFGGLRDGMQCTPGVEETCGPVEEGGVCERLSRADKYLGLEGYCLEYDYSININGSENKHPCLTWRPVEIPEGGQDVYNQYVSAGYNPPSASVGKYFCLMGRGNTDFGDYSQTRDNIGEISIGAGLIDVSYNELFYHRRNAWPRYKEGLAGIALRATLGLGEESSDVFYQDKNNILKREGEHNGEFQLVENGKTYSYWEIRIPGTDEGIDPWITGEDTYETEAPLFILPWTDGWQNAFDNGETVTFDYRNPDADPNAYIGAKLISLENFSGSRSCEYGDLIKGDFGNDYYAIRAVFDKGTDEFLGIWTAGCGPMVYFDVEFLLAEYCVDLAQVERPDGSAKARTHDIWEYSGTKLVDDYYGTYEYDQWNRPFGSAANRSLSANMSTEPWFIGADGSNGSPYFTTDYFTPGAIDAGSPLGCYTRGSTGEGGCFWEGTEGILSASRGSGDSEIGQRNAIAYLKKLFVSVYEIFRWRRDGNNSYIPVANRSLVWNDSADDGKSVMVAGVSNELNGHGMPKPVLSSGLESAISVNSVSEGFVSEGIVDGGSGVYEAVVRFYAWADKNQMPITSRWVDWRDGSPSEQAFGKYKNHKPICASSPTEQLGYCVSEFGRIVSPLEDNLPCFDDSDCAEGMACSLKFPNFRCSNDLDRGCNPDTTDPESELSCQRDYGDCVGGLLVGGYSCSLSSGIVCDPSFAIFDSSGEEDEDAFDPYDPYGEAEVEERRGCRIDYGECKDIGGFSVASFGNSPDACEESYFEFTHSYICNEEILAELESSVCIVGGAGEWDGSEEDAPFVITSPCRFDNKCVFKPDVRVVDNWGWCTAPGPESCTVVSDSGGATNVAKFKGLILLNP